MLSTKNSDFSDFKQLMLSATEKSLGKKHKQKSTGSFNELLSSKARESLCHSDYIKLGHVTEIVLNELVNRYVDGVIVDRKSFLRKVYNYTGNTIQCDLLF